jgi:tetratricopeptide (TPR) repeat protein
MATQFTFTQDKELDSIRQLVDVYLKRDTTRVNLLIKVTKYYTTRDLAKNETILKEAIEISKEINYQTGIYDSYSNLINVYIQLGSYDKALEYALKTKHYQEKVGDQRGLIFTNSSMAQIYTHFGEPHKSIKIQLENLELLKNKPNSNLKASIHFYLAKAYSEIKSYDDAKKQYLSAKKIAENSNFKTGVAIANSSIGMLENEKGNYNAAIKYLNKSLSFFKENNQLSNLAHCNMDIAFAYSKTDSLNKAIILNSKAIEYYEKQNSFRNLSLAYFNQSDFHKDNNDYKKSNEFLKKYYDVKDSILAKEKLSIIEDMQTKYETEKILKDKDITEQQLEITKLESKKNRNLFTGSLLITVLLLLSLFFYFDRLKTKKQAELVSMELKEAQKRLALEKQYKDSELKALKSQMNPHFIFNALNSIQVYIVLNQKNLASDYLGKFADLIRNYLHFSDTGFISIQEEVHNLNLYLELEKLRFEEELAYTFNVDETINSDFIKIPTMLIQPYVENALKHGLLHRKNNRKLNISIHKNSENIIECIIEDNGIGRIKSKEINKRKGSQHKSFALKATTERLDLLNFGKEKKIGVEIIDLVENEEAKGTKVVLKIPIIKR